MRAESRIGLLAVCLLVVPTASHAAEATRSLRLLTAHRAGTESPQIELESWKCVVGAKSGYASGEVKVLRGAPDGFLAADVTVRDTKGEEIGYVVEGLLGAIVDVGEVESFGVNMSFLDDRMPESCEIDFSWIPEHHDKGERGGPLRWVERHQ